MISIPHKMK